MIKITVELDSAISRTRDRLLGIAEIANDGTGNASHGNYVVRIGKAGSKSRETWRSGVVRDFPRKGRLGAWDLLYRALRDVVGERNTQSAEEAELDLVCEEYDAPGRYLCMSQSRLGRHVVDLFAWAGNGECSCEDWDNRVGKYRKLDLPPEKRFCKHIRIARRKFLFEHLDAEVLIDRLLATQIEQAQQANAPRHSPQSAGIQPDEPDGI